MIPEGRLLYLGCGRITPPNTKLFAIHKANYARAALRDIDEILRKAGVDIRKAASAKATR